jgi:hypothetical protein
MFLSEHVLKRGETNIEQLVLEFLNDFVVRNDAAEEFRRLSREATGNSRGWKFNCEEIQRKIR